MEKLLPVTDKSALRLGVSVGQFLGEAESNIEFEQVFGWRLVNQRGFGSRGGQYPRLGLTMTAWTLAPIVVN